MLFLGLFSHVITVMTLCFQATGAAQEQEMENVNASTDILDTTAQSQTTPHDVVSIAKENMAM